MLSQTDVPDRFHAQRFYTVRCLTTSNDNATPVKADMTLNMMLIEMPVANAADFYRHVQVYLECITVHICMLT